MNLEATIEIYAGGPGSGCNPEMGKCGRPGTGKKLRPTDVAANTVWVRKGNGGNLVRVHHRDIDGPMGGKVPKFISFETTKGRLMEVPVAAFLARYSPSKEKGIWRDAKAHKKEILK